MNEEVGIDSQRRHTIHLNASCEGIVNSSAGDELPLRKLCFLVALFHCLLGRDSIRFLLLR